MVYSVCCPKVAVGIQPGCATRRRGTQSVRFAFVRLKACRIIVASSILRPPRFFPQMLSLSHLAQPRFMAPLSTFASRSPLPLRFAARSICSIVPYNMPQELPPYMNISTSENSTTQNKPVLRMLLFGKPCSGKGTLAARLSKSYGISTISTGDLIRQHITARSVIFFGTSACH